MSYASNNTVSVRGLNLAARMLMILLTREIAARVSSSMSYVDGCVLSAMNQGKMEVTAHVVAI